MDKYPYISPYAYCNWNPIKYVDPDGKWIETAWDVANVIMGVESFVSNIHQGNVAGAVVDGVGVVLDAVATVLPVAPGGVSTAIKVARTADKVNGAGSATNKFLQAVARGIQNEKRVLKDMGLTKNTSKMASSTNDKTPINVIPDAIQEGLIYEIKDTKVLSQTKQIQGELNAANAINYKFKIITGEKTHISSRIPLDVIVRRSDLESQ